MKRSQIKWLVLGAAALLALAVVKPSLLFGQSVAVSVSTGGDARFGALIGGLFAGALVVAKKKFNIDNQTLLYAVGIFLAIVLFVG